MVSQVAKRTRSRARGWRRLADLTILPKRGSFRTYREATTHKEFIVALNVDQDRVVVREWRDEQSGALSDFVVTQQAIDSGACEWKDVARVDTRHGTVHMHGFDKSGSEVSRKEIRSYSTREELEDIYRRIDDELFEGWEENRRRWATG